MTDSPMVAELKRDLAKTEAELKATNDRNEQHKRDIERAKLEMLDKGTLIEELLRWTATAKRERADKTPDDAMRRTNAPRSSATRSTK